MMDGQRVPALLCALLGEGVQPETIEAAIARVRSLRLGRCISALATPGDPNEGSSNPLPRAWASEQAQRLEKA